MEFDIANRAIRRYVSDNYGLWKRRRLAYGGENGAGGTILRTVPGRRRCSDRLVSPSNGIR